MTFGRRESRALDQKSTREMTSEPVMFQGKWIETDDCGTWWVPDELIKQIQDNQPAAGTLFGKPVIIDTREHPGNCHNGYQTACGSIPNRDPAKHPDQCPMTRAALSEIGLTRKGACPTIRNQSEAKS